MAIKANELRLLDELSLQKKLVDLEKELMIETTQVKAGGRAPNPGKIKTIKKAIAVVRTIIHERKLNIKREVKKTVVKPKEETVKKETKNEVEKKDA
ncbi:50S ribosomal protein L29 [Candidatus Micrarchaeota archaeon]|jgi:ribosomal protein L29|nr:50S ribosomal protein L29 [Candidatus Micrarchaeota archaeon]